MKNRLERLKEAILLMHGKKKVVRHHLFRSITPALFNAVESNAFIHLKGFELCVNTFGVQTNEQALESSGAAHRRCECYHHFNHLAVSMSKTFRWALRKLVITCQHEMLRFLENDQTGSTDIGLGTGSYLSGADHCIGLQVLHLWLESDP